MNQKKDTASLERNPILDSKLIYFVGIGGIGMSGIAEILHNLGYQVKGSDLSENANVKRLKQLGVSVAIGQDAKNIEGADLVVRSSAVKDDNPEVKAAIENSIAVILRADMLAEIMRLKESIAVAGTHGKTTTTSMVTAMFEAAKLDPTVINGGIINSYGTNARLGSGKWMVAEADESDGTFLRLPASVGIITNIDPEHMEHYGSYDNLLNSFSQFIENLAFYGFGVLCNDHEEVAKLAKNITSRKIITYAIDCDADIRAVNIEYNVDSSTFDVEVSDRLKSGKQTIKSITLPMPGKHNISNALAAIATACEWNLLMKLFKTALMTLRVLKDVLPKQVKLMVLR